MKEIRSYHCNNCGALVIAGEVHVCSPERIAQIKRIADFLKNANHEDHKDEDQEDHEGSSWPS